MSNSRGATILFVLFGAYTAWAFISAVDPKAPLDIKLDRNVALHPALIGLDIHVPGNPINRLLVITWLDESGPFDESTIELNGDDAPNWFHRSQKGLGEGSYQVRVVLWREDKAITKTALLLIK